MEKKYKVSNSKITILCQLFYPELVSTGQTLTELAEELTLIGHAVTVYAAPPSIDPFRKTTPQHITYKTIKIERLWATHFSKLNMIGRITNALTFSFSTFFKLLLDKENTPILVLTNPPFLGWIIAFISLLKKRKFIYLIFDVYPETAIENGLFSNTSLISVIWKKFNTFTFEKASKVMVIGRCMKSKIEQHVTPKNKLLLTHVWADDKGIQSSIKTPDICRNKWGLKEEFIILYSGNIGRFHDIETILYAAKKLKDRTDIVFLFVGEGHKKSWSEDYATKHHLTNCVFKTYVPREELGNLLTSANLGIVSLLETQVGLSVPSKTFGLLAAGCPILGLLPKTCEISLILNDYKCGVISPPTDTDMLIKNILHLKNTPSQLSIMSENGKKCIKDHYNLSHAAKNISEAFVQL
jgi:glycosyltransferase involved in cell wall biosynthesis